MTNNMVLVSLSLLGRGQFSLLILSEFEQLVNLTIMFYGDFDPPPESVEIWEGTQKTRLCVTDTLNDKQLFTKPIKYLFIGIVFILANFTFSFL